MADTRTVTVSITINLGNYENLRLEVSDAAETKEDAENLRRFLSDILDGYGNNDATAKHAIDKYKERILADAGEEPEADAPLSYTFDLPMADPEPLVPAPIFEAPEPTEESADEIEEPPVSTPQVEPHAETAEFICSKCGAPVNKLQRDVSMMFNNKILCKACMK